MARVRERLRCWRCTTNRWLYQEELIKRKEGKGHIDLVCPVCESVVICRYKGAE
jgi:hypothetical protein